MYLGIRKGWKPGWNRKKVYTLAQLRNERTKERLHHYAYLLYLLYSQEEWFVMRVGEGGGGDAKTE